MAQTKCLGSFGCVFVVAMICKSSRPSKTLIVPRKQPQTCANTAKCYNLFRMNIFATLQNVSPGGTVDSVDGGNTTGRSKQG